MALYNKVAISFSRKVIDAPAGRSVIGLNAQGASRSTPSCGRHNRDAAIVFVGGAQARQLEEEGTASRRRLRAVSALAEIYGNELRGLLARSSVTRWGKDPFARGSWSMATPGNADKRLVLAQPHHDRVLFAGEATDPVWATRVGGAYASGLRAAREALAVLGAPKR